MLVVWLVVTIPVTLLIRGEDESDGRPAAPTGAQAASGFSTIVATPWPTPTQRVASP